MISKYLRSCGSNNQTIPNDLEMRKRRRYFRQPSRSNSTIRIKRQRRQKKLRVSWKLGEFPDSFLELPVVIGLEGIQNKSTGRQGRVRIRKACAFGGTKFDKKLGGRFEGGPFVVTVRRSQRLGANHAVVSVSHKTRFPIVHAWNNETTRPNMLDGGPTSCIVI